VTTLAGANDHAVYDAAGHVLSCGGDENGVLGDGKTRQRHVRPVQVKGLSSRPVTALVSSFDNAGALLADGKYYDWEYNASGQIGDGKK
jgi:alpha-tubulin suppressor-like RCC1 family protein